MAGAHVTRERSRLLARRYEPAGALAVGGEATVVRAVDHHRDKLVVLKIRPIRDRRTRAAGAAEARTLLALQPHRSIATPLGQFLDGDDHVLVMEDVGGPDLAQCLARDGAPGLPLPNVIGWLQDVADALDHLHRSDPIVVHGDVKPANVVITADTSRAVLVDFGHASPRSHSGGTRSYAAPELGSGQRTPAVDVFGLAATAHVLLAGVPPEPGLEPDWSVLPPRVRSGLRAVLANGLATAPERRPPSAGALVEALRRATRSG